MKHSKYYNVLSDIHCRISELYQGFYSKSIGVFALLLLKYRPNSCISAILL